MGQGNPIVRSAFHSFRDGAPGAGKRPVVFDILAPDRTTSLLPDEIKLVLHVNPRSMRLGYQKLITRLQTRGGFVEQHWGDALQDINFDQVTGGFVRLYAGLSNKTGSNNGGSTSAQGRRETIAYDKFLDMLALFHHNGAIYDVNGNIALQGYIKVTFDGGVYYGWFDTDFTISETAELPYQFQITSRFLVEFEEMSFRSTLSTGELTPFRDADAQATNQPVFTGGFSEP